jgi:hypothetical protein
VNVEEGMVSVKLSEAMECANCISGNKPKKDQLSSKTLKLLQKIQPIEEMDKDLARFVENGLSPKCEVREVLALHHPARWYTRPSERCFAVVANAKIQPGKEKI